MTRASGTPFTPESRLDEQKTSQLVETRDHPPYTQAQQGLCNLSVREEGPMTSAREAVTKAYQAVAASFQRGDADTIASLYTDDAELSVPGAPGH
jgi:hypothetical protein